MTHVVSSRLLSASERRLADRQRVLPCPTGRPLPPDVLDGYTGALVGEITAPALRRALAVATAGLLREAGGIPSDELAATVARVRPMLAEICVPAITVTE